MSSFVWMKILESAPHRYDRGLRILSGGRIGQVYDRIATLVAAPGRKILDIGCGTGALTLACAARGADVTGIDIDASMLEVARDKPAPKSGRVTFLELGAAEIEDRFGKGSFDAATACLAMSEMSPDEQDYVLHVVFSRLAPGGMMVIGDETSPAGRIARLAYFLWRLPLAAVTYLLTQATTRPVGDLAQRLRQAGFSDVKEERMWSGAFVIVQGVKRKS
jgi:ubiquinone/menaquinone biosynthesis C-methylase UbiE